MVGHSYPFDWKTPIGYFICCIIQMQLGYVTVLDFMFAITLICGFCVLLAATISDLERSLCQLNQILGSTKDHKISTEEHVNLISSFVSNFRFHFEMKELIIIWQLFQLQFFSMIQEFLIYFVIFKGLQLVSQIQSNTSFLRIWCMQSYAFALCFYN